MTFNLTQDQADYIIAVLAQRPYHECAPLISALQEQAKSQLPKPESEELEEAS